MNNIDRKFDKKWPSSEKLCIARRYVHYSDIPVFIFLIISFCLVSSI